MKDLAEFTEELEKRIGEITELLMKYSTGIKAVQIKADYYDGRITIQIVEEGKQWEKQDRGILS